MYSPSPAKTHRVLDGVRRQRFLLCLRARVMYRLSHSHHLPAKLHITQGPASREHRHSNRAYNYSNQPSSFRQIVRSIYILTFLLLVFGTLSAGQPGIQRPMASPSMARVYADVNQNMPRSYWDYDSVNISWGVLENYEVVRKIGAHCEPAQGTHTHTPSCASLRQ